LEGFLVAKETVNYLNRVPLIQGMIDRGTVR
jgi:hypothetical protein